MAPINNIESERRRVLAVWCPVCKSAIGQLCTQKINGSGGIQTKHTNIFHAERIVKANNENDNEDQAANM